MNWSEHLFHYCERGRSILFWAEPLNALSNAAFLIAGLAAIYLLRHRTDLKSNASRAVAFFLTGLLLTVAVGSFLFHTFATAWAERADQAPITIFQMSYLGFALVAFLRVRWLAALLGVAAFFLVSVVASKWTCSLPAPDTTGGIGVTTCLWGSAGYFPALAGLWGVGWVLWRLDHAAASSVLAAAGLFTVSLSLRTLDVPFCDHTIINGRAVGTHFAWHVLNACTLFVLLRAAIRHGSQPNRSVVS